MIVAPTYFSDSSDFQSMLSAWTLFTLFEALSDVKYTVTHNSRGTYITVNGEKWYCLSSHPIDIANTLEDIVRTFPDDDELDNPDDNPPSTDPPPTRGPQPPLALGGL